MTPAVQAHDTQPGQFSQRSGRSDICGDPVYPNPFETAFLEGS